MKYLKLVLITLVTITITSCSGILNSENMADQKVIDKVIEKAGKEITLDNVKKVVIRSAGDLEEGYGSITVTYKKDKDYYDINYKRQLSDPRKAYILHPDKKEYAKSPAKKVVDFKFDNVVTIYNKAVEQIKSQETNVLENFTLNVISRKLKADGTFETELIINTTKIGESTRRSGRKITTIYYPIVVDVNTDGTFKLNYK